MKSLHLLPLAIGAAILALLAVPACDMRSAKASTPAGYPDTLRVATLSSPLSYFLYKDEPMGYDYDLLMQLAQEKGMALDLHIVKSLDEAVGMLDSGKIDLIAFEVPITSEYRDKVLPAGPENITFQVLVQPKGDSLISNVKELAGREIMVEKDSKYEGALAGINAALPAHERMEVIPVEADTVSAEELIRMVSTGEIPLTVVDSDIARINKNYYKNLDVSMQLSSPQRSAWGVSPATPWLADSINSWSYGQRPRMARSELLQHYFDLSRESYTSPNDATATAFRNGRMSSYDHLFKQHASAMDIDWDWRLLAAQGHTESNYNPKAKSWAGARGIMQIMPRTAKSYGLSMSKIHDSDANIKTATEIITHLDELFKDKVPDGKERIKFVLAAYNAGQGHVLDAMALAKKYGKNPAKWDGNVAEAILMKQKPKYYRDPVVKYGYCRGRETYAYVNKIMDYYNKAVRKVPK